MTRIKKALVGVAVLALSVCVKADTTVVPVVDKSAAGSPLEITGTVTLSETVRNGKLIYASDQNVTARNISQKTILTMVIWLEAFYPRGPKEKEVKQYECFFAPDVIAPSDVHSLSRSAELGDTKLQDYDESGPLQEPSAEVRVMYVQFLDGSVFGHPAFGEEILKLRRKTWQVLRNLDTTYLSRGEDAFVQVLYEPVDEFPVDALVANVRVTHKKFGTPSALGQVRKMLRFAEQRQALIGGGGPPI